MANRRKVLTVSYGRFHCTLEGFDDPTAALREVIALVQDAAESAPGFGGVAPADAALPDPDAADPAQAPDAAVDPDNPARTDDPAAPGAAHVVHFGQRRAPPAPARGAAPQAAGPDLAEFAARLGAVDLVERAEAAALHAALVAGRASVSRAEMLHDLRLLAPDAGRDAIIRAFVTLRRDGRLAQVGPGRFSVTERCPLMATARHIAS